MEAISPRDVAILCEEIAPLMLPDGTLPAAALFDEQMFTLMLTRANRGNTQDLEDILTRRVRMLSRLGSIEKIQRQKKYINRILFNGEWKNAPLKDLETARRALSPLIRYIAEEEERAVYLDLTDRILAEAYLPDPCTAFPES